ncbi:aminoglycoside phosphotransferase family protein [Kribbella sp. NPDC005582]|uniref:phosphotransferase family protein n=1 Tax=Kribbella sp. NPDC005582 TaxID=3156893 RepID=UPI0033B1EBBD
MDRMLDDVRLLAHRYDVAPADVHEVPGGVANRGFVLGPRLFVRVARSGFEDDLRKETAVVPVARAAGVRTPAILEYDESRAQVDASYVVVERIHGVEPLTTPSEVALELARLHSAERVSLPGVADDGWGEPRATVADLATRGYLDTGTADWLTGWFDRLERRFDRSAPPVLLHGDVAPHNLLVDPADGSLQALIDWGDAAWGPRAIDFAKLRLTEVAHLLPAYLAATTLTADELAAGILYLHLSWALAKLPTAPWPSQRHWTAPPTSRVLNLLTFFTTNPPHPWPTLT